LVVLPEMMRQHMLANMRDHLRAIAEIQGALADGQFDVARDVAEDRLGMSSLASHGASHIARHMPEPMRAIGSQMHRAASQFALIAEEASVDRDLSSCSRKRRGTVGCHYSRHSQRHPLDSRAPRLPNLKDSHDE
jgi:hypothetical protein